MVYITYNIYTQICRDQVSLAHGWPRFYPWAQVPSPDLSLVLSIPYHPKLLGVIPDSRACKSQQGRIVLLRNLGTIWRSISCWTHTRQMTGAANSKCLPNFCLTSGPFSTRVFWQVLVLSFLPQGCFRSFGAWWCQTFYNWHPVLGNLCRKKPTAVYVC